MARIRGLKVGPFICALACLSVQWMLIQAESPKGTEGSCKPDDEVCQAEQQKLPGFDSGRFEKDLSDLFGKSETCTAEEFENDMNIMGPGHIWCQKRLDNGEWYTLSQKSYGNYPASGHNAGMALRSISKIFVSAAFMALTHTPTAKDAGLNLDSKVGDFFKNCGILEKATLRELFAMNATGIDNRIAVEVITQRQKEGKPFDHVGFPSICDELGYGISECAEKVVCPAYAEGNEYDSEKMDSIPDSTCTNLNPQCPQYAANGYCALYPRFMAQACSPACKYFCCDDEESKDNCLMLNFDKKLCKTAKDEQGNLLADTVCRRTCKTCSHEEELKLQGWHLSFDESSMKPAKKIRIGCVYDNYGYTLVDAVVEKATGKSMIHWIVELVMKPLKMTVGLKCMGFSANEEDDMDSVECYRAPEKIEHHVDSSLWPKSSSFGLESDTWISNALFTSARDFAVFNQMLMNNGTWNGQTIMQKEDVDEILNPVASYAKGGDCIGVQYFGLGAGYCKEPPMSQDEVIEYYRVHQEIPEKQNPTLCEGEDYW
eukprot:CAMPEP_0184023926 /NCGR_PEP_ID=MMETSP0954-20121128/11705_1 /TAXON_ID=627963 /ORGANISM="Aplanochytrium sp, Strain PBS07" /LENGTH=543 /DNA_ID=CAMNT_0026307011 /DNA_START=119 /DNA_END=1747 /DNA_ORIENTATION=-